MKLPRITVLLFVLFLAPMPALAWSALGHRLVGELAALRLTPQARARVDALLAGEPEPTLGGVAYWADALRQNDPPRFRTTSRWHYINAKGGGCGFVVERDCPDGSCVVAAIEAQRRILADRSQPLAARRDALKFLVHLVGDVHQPMHAGNREDQGGNQFQVSLRIDIEPEEYARRDYVDGVMGTNLHAVWDYYILADARRTPKQYVAQLRRGMPQLRPREIGTPLAWASESCALIDARGIYPDRHTMDRTYLRAMRKLAEQRVTLAAARLAALLNETLGASRD
jgi:hypothetical protein